MTAFAIQSTQPASKVIDGCGSVMNVGCGLQVKAVDQQGPHKAIGTAGRYGV